VIGGRRANHYLWAQFLEPLNCWLDFDHTSIHGERYARVENMQWATRGGDKGMLRFALVSHNLNYHKSKEQIRNVPNGTIAGY